MKSSKFKNIILLLFISNMLVSCVTLQQPLPGILWGNWAFVETGTIIDGSNQILYDYRNVCNRERDRLHFSSDNKMNLRWYDEGCIINQYLIGRYHVEHNTLKISLADSPPHRDSPFPLITEYRIIRINATTLKLEEIPNPNWRNRNNPKSGYEALVFVFMRIE